MGQDAAGDWGTYGRIFPATWPVSGTPGSEFLVNTTTAGYQALPQVTATSDGGFYAIWHSDHAGTSSLGGYYLFGQRFDASGAVVGGETQISSNALTDVVKSICALPNGDVVALWTSSDAEGRGIFGQIINSSGTLLGQFPVNTAVASDQWGASATALADGGFIVMWQGSQTDSAFNVYGQRYNASGVAQGTEFQVNTAGTGYQAWPSVTALHDGGFLAVWDDAVTGGGGAHYVFGQRFDAAGGVVGSEFQISSVGYNGANVNAHATTLADGSVEVTWQGADADGAGVFSQRLSITGTTTMALTGGAGNDTIVAGVGVTVLDAGSGGSDTLLGGSDPTTFLLHGDLGASDTVTGNSGADHLVLSGGTLADSAFSHVSGIGTLNLVNTGGTPLSVVLGSHASSAGFTTVDASASTGGVVVDTTGDALVTTVIGGGGNDTLNAGSGGDMVTGGAGNDTFVIAANAGTLGKPLVITDFHSGTDKIDLTHAIAALDYNPNGNWLFNITSSIFSLPAVDHPTLAFLTNGTNGWLAFEGGSPLDGTVIELMGVTTAPAASDFITFTNTPPVLAGVVDANHLSPTLAIATNLDTTVTETLSASDVDSGDVLTYTLTGGNSLPAHGTATVVNGILSYTPNAGYSGSDSVGVTVSDGNGGTDSKTFTIAVSATAPATTILGVTEATGVLASTGSSVAASAKIAASAFANHQLSVEFDVNVPLGLAASAHSLLSLRNSDGTPLLDARIDAGGHLALGVNNTGTGTIALGAGTWHHIAITFDGTHANIYLDGNTTPAETVNVSQGLLSTLDTLTLGSAGGMFDNLKLWDAVLSSAQIADTHGLGTTLTANLVGQWTFNDTTAGTVANLAGDGASDMVLGGSAYLAQPPVRGAHFDATHSVAISNVATGSNSVTYAAWFRTTGTGSEDILAIGDPAATNGAIYLNVSGGHVGLAIHRGSDVNDVMSNATVNDGLWHHVAVTVADGVATVYVDGVYDSDNPEIINGNLNITTGTGVIGQSLTGTDHFTGDIADVQVWNTALTADTIPEVMNGPVSGHDANLVGYWTLDEGSGTVAHDLTGAHDGTYSAGASWTTGNHADIVHTAPQGSALTFSGSGQYANAGNIFNVGTGDFTMEAWVNPSTLGKNQMIIAKDTGDATSDPVMSLYLDSNGLPVFHSQGFNLAGTTPLTVGDWAHLAISRSGDQYTLYVNGVPEQTMTGPVSDLSNSYDLLIGARTLTGGIDTNTVFHGQIADVALLATGLGPDEVAASMSLQPSSATPGVVAAWTGTGTGTTDASGNGHDLTLTGATVSAGSPPVYDHLVDVTQGMPYHGTLVATDTSGATLTYGLQTGSSHGTVSVAADGSFAYTPATTYVGVDSFVLTVNNGSHIFSQTVAVDVHSPIDVLGARQNSGALSFNGSQYADAGNAGALATLGSGDFTMETWINLADVTTEQVLLGKEQHYSGSDPQMRLGVVDGHLFFMGQDSSGNGFWDDGYALQSAQALTVGQWTHVAVTRHGDEFTLYIDGKADTTTTLAMTSMATSSDLLIGETIVDGNPDHGVKGEVTDVQVWDHARSATEMAQSYNQVLSGDQSGLIGYWNGTGLADLSGNGHDLTLPDGSAVVPPAHALHFDGSTSIASQANLDLGSHTVEAWIRTSDAAGGWDGGIFSTKGNDPTAQWVQMSVYDGKLEAEVKSTSASATAGFAYGKSYLGSTNIADGLWHNVAYSVDIANNSLTLYVDGVQESTTTFGGWDGDISGLSVSALAQIGTMRDDYAKFTGDIADVQVWDGALSADQIQQNMNTEPTGSETGLLANWRLDDASGATTLVDAHNNLIPLVVPPETHDGTVTGSLTSVATGLTADEPQTGLHFNGSSYVTSSNAINLASHSVDAWVHIAPGTPSWVGIFSTETNSNNNQPWIQMVVSDGKLHVQAVSTAYGDGTSTVKDYEGDAIIADGAWHNVAYTLDTASDTLKLYVDGVLQTITANADGSLTDFDVNTPVRIGNNRDGNGALSNGNIADVTVWDSALSATQIHQVMTTEPTGDEVGLVANWRLDEASNATTVVDSHTASSLTSVETSAPIYDQSFTAEYGGVPYHGDLAGTSSVNGATLSWQPEGGSVGTPMDTAHGSVTINADGSFTYTPASNWHGVDSFTVQATGSDGTSVEKVIAIDVPSPVDPIGVAAAGGSLQFNGSQLASNSSILLSSQSFSFEFWANQAEPSATQTLLAQTGAFSVTLDNDHILHFAMEGGGEITVNGVQVGQWTHWAGSYDAATHTMNLYEDGQLVGTATGPSSFTGTGSLVVGNDVSGGTNGFIGQMDEVRLFNTALSAADVASDQLTKTPANTDALIADWTMDKVLNTTHPYVADSSAAGHDLTLGAGSGYDATVPLYVNTAGQALAFDGAADHVSFTNATLAAHPLTAITIEGWIRTSGADGTIMVIGDTTGSGSGITVDVNGGHLGFTVGNGSEVGSGISVDDGVWHYVALTLSGGTANLYLDGNSIPVATVSGQASLSISNGSGSFGGGFGGDMSDLRVWDYARTGSEIASNMDHRLTGQEAGLVDNWRLDDVYSLEGRYAPDTTGNAEGAVSGATTTDVKPTVYSDTTMTREDTTTRGSLAIVDTDNPSATFTTTLTQQAAHGTVTLDDALGYSYTPDAHYFGSDSFVVAIDDGRGGSLTYETVGVQVKETHEAPQVSGAGDFTTDTSGLHVLGLSVADPIGELGFQKYQVTLSDSHGLITLNTTGGLTFGTNGVNGTNSVIVTGTLDRINAALATATYVAGPSFTTDTLNLTVVDISADSAGDSLVTSSAMAVTVADRAPTITSSGLLRIPGGGGTGSSTFHATDPEGETLTYFGTVAVAGQGPSHGTLTLTNSSTGAYTYTANSGYFGSDSFTWSVADTAGNITQQTERVEIYSQAEVTVAVDSDFAGITNPAYALAKLSGATITHSSGDLVLGGLELMSTLSVASSMTVTNGTTLTLDVGGTVGANSLLDMANGTVLLGANALLKSGGLVAMTGGGTLTGSGTLQQTGGNLTLSGIGNDIGVAFQNAAATLLLVTAVNGGSAAEFNHGFDNLGAIQLDSAAGSNATYASALTIDGTLINDGSLTSTGTLGSGGHHSLTAAAFDNDGAVQVGHDLWITTDTFLNQGSLILSGATLTVQDDTSHTNSTHAAFTSTGVISGSGLISDQDAAFVNHGYITPGNNAAFGTLHVSGDMVLASDSHVVLDVSQGGSFGANDLLWDSGTLTLGGDLVVNDHGVHSTSATLLEWATVSGEFNSIHGLDDSANAWLLDPVFSAGSLTVTGHGATVLGANSLFSDTSGANNYVIGDKSGGDEVHLGGGADVFVGHGGGNTVGVSDTAFHFLDGGTAGNNELVWEGAASSVLDFTKLQTNAVQNFDVLKLGTNGANTTVLDLSHLTSMTNGTNAVTGTTHSLVVIGSDQNTSTVSFADAGWHVDGQAALTVNGHQDSYTQYSNGDVHVLVDSHTHVA